MFFVPILAALALAQDAPASTRYDACVARIQENVVEGRKAAQQWALEGGGAEAQHCLAVADLAAGFNKLAAARLEELADRRDAGDDYIRARLLDQAALAWLEAKDVVRAEAALKAALDLVPDSGELQLTRAKVSAAKENWNDVIDAVTLAEDTGFVSAETYVLQSRAYIAMGDYENAARGVVNALRLDPMNIDALTLRGEIQQTGIEINVNYTAKPAGD